MEGYAARRGRTVMQLIIHYLVRNCAAQSMLKIIWREQVPNPKSRSEHDYPGLDPHVFDWGGDSTGYHARLRKSYTFWHWGPASNLSTVQEYTQGVLSACGLLWTPGSGKQTQTILSRG
jgi:hypothetical protein